MTGAAPLGSPFWWATAPLSELQAYRAQLAAHVEYVSTAPTVSLGTVIATRRALDVATTRLASIAALRAVEEAVAYHPTTFQEAAE